MPGAFSALCFMIKQAIQLLKETSRLYASGLVDSWSIKELSRHLRPFVGLNEVLESCFHLFVKLIAPHQFALVSDSPIDDLPQTEKVLLLESRFLCTLFLLCFFRSQKSHHALSPLLFLLHYRGLSQSGFHLLNSIGLSPVPKTISKLTKQRTYQSGSSISEFSVVWFDNLRRTQRGWVDENVRVDHTVLAQTELDVLPELGNESDCLFDEVPGYLWSAVAEDIEKAFEIKVLTPNSPLFLATSLSNPIRVSNSPKYPFVELGVLPIRCGEMKGTLEVVDSLREKGFWNFTTIRPLVVDYDLWWRLQRIILSESCIGSFETIRRNTLLIQGPWHLYKVFAEAFWRIFGPLFVFEVHLCTSTKASPVASKTPELKQITETLIGLWSWKRDQGNFRGSTVFARLIKMAMDEIVPLVSDFCLLKTG
jgi:hypothetical protein